MGEQVLTLAVLSILITAPLGAIGILGLGPKLLSCDLPETVQDQDIEQNRDQENRDQNTDQDIRVQNTDQDIRVQNIDQDIRVQNINPEIRNQDVGNDQKILEKREKNKKVDVNMLQELLLVVEEDTTWDGRGEKMKESNE